MIPLVAWYVVAAVTLLLGTAAIFMALLPPFPVSWLYHHARSRKPAVWLLLSVSLAGFAWEVAQTASIPLAPIPPLVLTALGVVLAHRMHQEVAFPAIDFPPMSPDPLGLPLRDELQLAVIDVAGVARAYPLDFVIHHHVVNDRFGDRIVSLTYCAMCRSIIPFDVTGLGPLFVGSFKNANMIVADRRTRTFFQQATFESLIGPLHPRTLTMLPFQLLSWADVKRMLPAVQVAQITESDLREFQLPIPGVWRRIVASESTPGLPARQRDRTFPSRTHVIGVIDRGVPRAVVYLKAEVVDRRVVRNEELGFFLIAAGDAVNGFRAAVRGTAVEMLISSDRTISDRATGTRWDLRGRKLSGPIEGDLVPIALSDEYWFSWKRFHPEAELIRVGRGAAGVRS